MNIVSALNARKSAIGCYRRFIRTGVLRCVGNVVSGVGGRAEGVFPSCAFSRRIRDTRDTDDLIRRFFAYREILRNLKNKQDKENYCNCLPSVCLKIFL